MNNGGATLDKLGETRKPSVLGEYSHPYYMSVPVWMGTEQKEIHY
jgi:hypothetical protein